MRRPISGLGVVPLAMTLLACTAGSDGPTATGADGATDVGSPDVPTADVPPGADTGAPKPAAKGDSLVEVARWAYDGGATVRDLELLTGALLACTGDGLQALDPVTLAEAGSLPMADGCRRVSASGPDTALATTSAGGLVEVRWSAGALEAIDGRSYAPGGANPPLLAAIATQQGKVLAAAGDAGVVSVDLDGGSASPAGVGTSSRDIALSGDLVLVADGDAGLLVLTPQGAELAQLALPSGADPSAPPRRALRVQGSGTHAVVTTPLATLLIDLATAGSPGIAATLDAEGTPVDATLLDGDLLATAEWGALRAYDVADAAAPRLVGTEETRNPPSQPLPLWHFDALAADGETLFAAGPDGVVRLSVLPEERGPDVELLHGGVYFTGVAAGESTSGGFLISNSGDEQLVVSSLTATNEAFTLTIDEDFAGPLDDYDPRPAMVVLPGQKAFVDIAFTAPSADPVTALMLVESNDPDEATLQVPMVGNFRRLEVGDVAPEIVLPDLDGTVVTLSSLFGQVVYLKLFNGT